MEKIKVAILDDYQNVTHKFADWDSLSDKIDLKIFNGYIGNDNNLAEQLKDYDVLFYISPEGVEIEDNGIRETDAEYRDLVDKKIKSITRMFRSNTITIKGTVEERIEQVKNAVAQYV